MGIPVLYSCARPMAGIFDVETAQPPASPADGGRPSKEMLRAAARRIHGRTRDAAPATIEALEDLTRRGRELHGLLADDSELLGPACESLF